MIFALDDDPLVLDVIREALAPLDAVHTASLWTEVSTKVLRAGASKDPVVFICDLKMPGTDGLQFCHVLKRYVPDVRIVIFSAAIDEYDPQRLREVTKDFVPKDAGVAELVRRVSQILREVRPDESAAALKPIQEVAARAKADGRTEFLRRVPHGAFLFGNFASLADTGLLTRGGKDARQAGFGLVAVIPERVAAESVSLGRSLRCDIPVRHEGVSRTHAYLTLDEAGYLRVSDAGSTYGTSIGGQRLPGGKAHRLLDKDDVRFGRGLNARYHDAAGLLRVLKRWM